jgi:hypothetical protein
MDSAKEMAILGDYVVFPSFATYWPKLALFAVFFVAIMSVVVSVAVAPAPLTPNYRMLYDIVFGSHADAEAKLDTYIRTAMSLRPNNESHTESFVPEMNASVPGFASNPWSEAARRSQEWCADMARRAFATLFVAGHRVSVNADSVHV